MKASGSIFTALAQDTWERLRDARSLNVRFGEETITDLLLLDIKRKKPASLRIIQTSKFQEKLQGTDFELWIGSNKTRWLRFAIQAKRIQKNLRYHGLRHTVPGSGALQIDLLEAYAKAKRAKPLYCFYNHVPTVDSTKHWHCCKPYEQAQLGVTIALPSTVRSTFHRHGTKNFGYIHKAPHTVPWRCIVECLRAQACLRRTTVDGQASEVVGDEWTRELVGGETNAFKKLPPEIEQGRVTGQLESPVNKADADIPAYPRRILVYDIDASEPQD